MINQFALNKALLDKLVSISDFDGFVLARAGTKFTPEIDQDYITEKEVPTNNELPLGKGKETQRGFYQVTICTPYSKGRFYHLRKVDDLRPQFGKGLDGRISFYDTYISIGTIDPSGMYSDDTHLKTALTINYTVIA